MRSTKKRGASADREKPIAENRRKYPDTSAVPVAELPTTIDPNKPLTEKAKLFVKYWAQGDSIPNAAARAGYGDGATYAYRLVHFPQARALYEAEKAKYEEAAQMSRKKVMDGLLEAVEMAKLMAEPATMVSGWREIGRMCGYYEPVKKTIDINVSGNVVYERLNKLSDAELLKLIQQQVTNEAALALEHDDDDDEDE